ncbi:MAG: helix-turn-helix domain-containing protein [Pseudomonadales bacterium]
MAKRQDKATKVALRRPEYVSSKRTHSRYTRDALRLLGQQVQISRKQLGWSERELAERAGIDRGTVRKVEAGSPTVAVGTSLEVAHLVRVPLFVEDAADMSRSLSRMQEMLALLPKKIQPKRKIDDDF